MRPTPLGNARCASTTPSSWPSKDGPGRIGETIAQLTDLLAGDPALLDEETGLSPDEVRDVLERLARRVD